MNTIVLYSILEFWKYFFIPSTSTNDPTIKIYEELNLKRSLEQKNNFYLP